MRTRERRFGCTGGRLAVAAVLALAPSGPLRAQDDGFIRVPGATAGDTVEVPAGDYGAGWLHRVFFGSRYRDLWTTPVRVPVLDLATEQGGLRPEGVGGGMQTRSLRLRAADGREFAFRSVDKDPSSTVPEALRGSIAEDIFRDQVSAAHPAGALVASPILAAAGVPHAVPRLFVMPDDARLGEFRGQFAGLLGMLEERPAEREDGPGFAGALDVKGTDGMLEELAEDPAVPVDARAFLTARLLDVYLGDWDRHPDQWRWGLVQDARGRRWIPIPRDRDQAFSRYDGLLLGSARRVEPKLLDFGKEYASPFAATWNGRQLDRRLLTGLERPVWDSTARALRAVLTDAVLDAAVASQPPEYAAEAPRLREALEVRREGLVEYAGRFYEFLAAEVDVHGSDRDDRVRVDRGRDSTLVTIHAAGTPAPIFRRAFRRGETDELRIYLGKGDDSAAVSGRDGPRVRVIGEGGQDRMQAADGAGVSFYDLGEGSSAEGASLSRRPGPEPPPVRDWGSWTTTDVLVTGSSDLGVMPIARVAWRRYGFRQVPWARKVTLEAAYSTGFQAGRVILDVEDPLESSTTMLTLRLLGSGLETLRFYGIGNGTTDEEDHDFYKVEQQAIEVRPGIRFGREGGWQLDLAAGVRIVRTDPGDENADRIVGLLEPPGTGTVGRAGVGAALERDTRDRPLGARTGTLLRARAAEWPVTWDDAEGGFGSAGLEAHAHLSPGDGPVTLAGRVGGTGVWGDAPFDELAYLGGFRTLRGYRQNRFAGDQSAFAAGEVRLRLFTFRDIVPGEFGVFGAGDIGRVFVGGDDDETWHRSAGGGGYFAFVERTLVLVAGVAGSVEGTLFYFGLGFPD